MSCNTQAPTSLCAMRAIAPMAKMLWGDAPKSPPQECCYVILLKQ